MVRMVKVCIVALAMTFSAYAVSAQETAQNTLVITVQDQSNAVIPGAGIRIVEQTTGKQFDAIADRVGQAELHLPSGTYVLRVQAPGFQTWHETNLEPKAMTQRTITLRIGNSYSGPVVEIRDMPLEAPKVKAQLAMASVELLPLRARWLRVRRHA
jgi:hypothetical protein